MPERFLNLVEPLGHPPTAMHTTDTTGHTPPWSGAAAPLVGNSLRSGGVDSSAPRRMTATTPSRRTLPTATATGTTRTTLSSCAQSADSTPHGAPFTFAELAHAWQQCEQHKRTSASATTFRRDIERNLCDLHAELQASAWRPGPSTCFVVTHPRPREVWAAQFRDRVVHQLLYNAIAPGFLASFIANSSACIPGRGTQYAAQRLEHDVRSITHNWQRPAHYLKCDLANFFVGIHKPTLQAQLHQRVTHPYWRWLTDTVLMHDPRTNYTLRGDRSLVHRVPPHKRLLNAPADTGLPIGNLSSQFFANVHLDALDQHTKHTLRARHYGRYVDDFYILHASTQWLASAREHLTTWLPHTLGAAINPSKTVLQPLARGIDFVGQVIKPWRRTTRRRTVATAVARLQHMHAADLFTTGNSYLGTVRQASHSHQQQATIARALRQRGHAVAGDLTKIYRSATT